MDLHDPTTLLGTWRLERLVDDRRLAEGSHVSGSLVLARLTADEVSWQESATWHRADGDVPVRRGLRLVLGDDGWWVRFDDGRDFHPWTPGEDVVHACDPDTYRGRISGTPDAWTVVWEVSGPTKDYTMTTVLTPA
jgi:hypothetical protein